MRLTSVGWVGWEDFHILHKHCNSYSLEKNHSESEYEYNEAKREV